LICLQQVNIFLQKIHIFSFSPIYTDFFAKYFTILGLFTTYLQNRAVYKKSVIFLFIIDNNTCRMV